jgi:membrane fusion protein (multidrug efflux system)
MPQITCLSLSLSRLLPLALAACTALGCQPAEASARSLAPEAAAVAVAETRAAQAAVPRYLVLTGTLRGERETVITSDVAGRVIDTLVERGAAVRGGEPVVRVDATLAAIGQSEAVALARAARVEEALAKADCDRSERLFADAAISPAEHERLLAACAARTHSAAAARAREARATRSVRDATIRAPFDGVVDQRLVSVGEYVQPGRAVARLAQIGSLRLELTVPESGIPAVHVGQKVTFSVAALPGATFEGELRHVGATLDPVTRSLVVEAEVPNPGARLRPGMFATARLVVGSDPRVVVPTEALLGEGRSRRLFVIRDQALEERVVLVGEAVSGRTAVLAGLSEGDRVVARPGPDTKDGLRVR